MKLNEINLKNGCLARRKSWSPNEWCAVMIMRNVEYNDNINIEKCFISFNTKTFYNEDEETLVVFASLPFVDYEKGEYFGMLSRLTFKDLDADDWEVTGG